MSCLSIRIKPTAQCLMDVTAADAAKLSTEGVIPSGLSVKGAEAPRLSVSGCGKASLSVRPTEQATLTAIPVCSAGGERILVLAASDGILLTRDGGYLLLDPSRSQNP